MKNKTTMTDRYITARLRRIEWMVGAGRIDKARDALNLLKLRANAENCGMGERLYPWDKRIKAIERSFVVPMTFPTQFGEHTPGAWYTTARNGAYQSQVCQEVTGKTIAVTYTSNDADAHLIAAAPDLLEACSAALAMFNDQMFIWGKDDDQKVCHMTRELARAIAKAEGK